MSNKAIGMKVGKQYRVLPDTGLKSELHNATVECVENDGIYPLIRAIKVGRRRGRSGGMLIHNGDTLRLFSDAEVEEA